MQTALALGLIVLAALQAPALPPGVRAASDPPRTRDAATPAPAAAAASASAHEPWVHEAIAQGLKGKLPDTTITRSSGWSNGRVHFATFSTPFTRVASAAAAAKKAYKTFTIADVTPELTAPELHVYAHGKASGAQAVSIEAVVITPRKGNEDEKRARAIQPTRQEAIPTTFRNLMGAEFTGEDVLAVFPLSALTEDNEVHVVYSRHVSGGGSTVSDGGCTDCRGPFKLKNVRIR